MVEYLKAAMSMIFYPTLLSQKANLKVTIYMFKSASTNLSLFLSLSYLQPLKIKQHILDKNCGDIYGFMLSSGQRYYIQVVYNGDKGPQCLNSVLQRMSLIPSL